MKNEDSAKIIFHRELVIDIEKKKKDFLTCCWTKLCCSYRNVRILCVFPLLRFSYKFFCIISYNEENYYLSL